MPYPKGDKHYIAQTKKKNITLKLLCANRTTAFRGYLLSFSTLTGTGDRRFTTSQKSVRYTCFQARL